MLPSFIGWDTRDVNDWLDKANLGFVPNGTGRAVYQNPAGGRYVEPGTDVEDYIQRAGKIFPFLSVEKNVRNGSNDIEKRHFRFHFQSPRIGKEINILLDVVFERNPYKSVVEKPIHSSLLMSEGKGG